MSLRIPRIDVPLAASDHRRRLGVLATVIVLLAVGSLAAITAPGQGATSTKPHTLKLVVEVNRDADARDDLPPAGDSPGDQVMFADPVFDAANRSRIGRAMFLNTFQEAQGVLVAGALRLKDGTITLAGARVNGAGSLAVTGGTGHYAGARGTYTEATAPIAPPTTEDGPTRHRVTIVFTS
jgi:hypothetical protein